MDDVINYLTPHVGHLHAPWCPGKGRKHACGIGKNYSTLRISNISLNVIISGYSQMNIPRTMFSTFHISLLFLILWLTSLGMAVSSPVPLNFLYEFPPYDYHYLYHCLLGSSGEFFLFLL